MNPTNIRRAVLLLAVVALGAAGCSKKHVSVPQPPPATTEDKTPVTPPTPKPAEEKKPPVEMPTANVKDLHTVYFALDSDQLTGEAQGILDANARILAANTSLHVEVGGHCDERGTEEYNTDLSERRANKVVDYLAARGVAASQLKAVPYGKTQPVAEGHDESAWSQNRRVEFK